MYENPDKNGGAPGGRPPEWGPEISPQVITPEIQRKDSETPIEVINGALDILEKEERGEKDDEPTKPTLH